MSIPTPIRVVAVAGASLLLANAQAGQLSGNYLDRTCPCRHAGGEVALGDVVCLQINGKQFLARCEMVLNNPSWRPLEEGCPLA